MAAEAEAVGEEFLDADFAGGVRDVVEVAAGLDVLVLQVDGRVQDAVLEAHGAGHGLDAAGGAEQVADHALGARDHQSLRVVAEDLLDGLRFGHVSQAGARPVGVDVLHVVGRPAGVAEGGAHGLGGADALLVRRGDVVGVGRVAAAGNLGIDRRPPRLGPLVFLQDEDAGSLR